MYRAGFPTQMVEAEGLFLVQEGNIKQATTETNLENNCWSLFSLRSECAISIRANRSDVAFCLKERYSLSFELRCFNLVLGKVDRY